MEGPNLGDLSPSRGSGPIAISNMDAGGTKPSGDSIPSPLPSPILTMQDPVNFATARNTNSALLKDAAPTYDWGIVEAIRKTPLGVIEKRSSALQFPPSMSDQLDSANTKWRAKLPPGSPASIINFALIHFLSPHLDYPDKSPSSDLTAGTPLVGSISES